MSTRGMFGFRVVGRLVLIANHWDSYLERKVGLGHDLMEFLYDNRRDLDRLREYVTGRIETIEGDENEDGDSWEKPLPKLRALFASGKVFRNQKNDDFRENPSCCYVYVADLDRMVLEVYRRKDLICEHDISGLPRKRRLSRVREERRFRRIMTELADKFDEKMEVMDKLSSL